MGPGPISLYQVFVEYVNILEEIIKNVPGMKKK
jgi:hypothetical protein